MVKNVTYNESTQGSTTSTYAYDSNGVRVSEKATSAGPTTYFLNDPQNPTGYAKAIEESTSYGSTRTLQRTYSIGMTVESQTSGPNASPASTTRYYLHDGHGSTRALLDAAGAVASGQSFAYTSFGDAIGFTASSAQTPWLFGGDGLYDSASGHTYHLARFRDGFRFTSYDSFEADPASPGDLHKFVAFNGNPNYFIDPSGHDGDVMSTNVALGIGALLFTIGLGAALSSSFRSSAAISLASHAVNVIEDWIGSGVSELEEIGSKLLGKSRIIEAAISSAIAAASAAAIATWQASSSIPPIFPIIRSAGPAIYTLDVAALATHPQWWVLTYNGPLSITTVANRAEVWTAYGWMMATAPPGSSLDEFPYASTAEGGTRRVTGPAVAAPVPWLQNAVQGGLLSAFYRYSLKGVAGKPFLVVPVPL